MNQGSRSIWKRLAAASTVLALAAAPVWASEVQLKKKEEPKAKPQEQVAQQKDGEKQGASETAEKKKNCPIDNSTFNTLEDLYGFLGTVDELALPKEQPAEVAEKPTGGESAGTRKVEWRETGKSEDEDESEDQDDKDDKE